MPDPWTLLVGMGAAAGLATVLFLALAALWRQPRRGGAALGALLGVGIGFGVGCVANAGWPHWPPREDQDRFLLVLIPAVLVVELIALVPKIPHYAAWLARVLVAGAAGPTLLYNTIYLTDLAGPGTREWSAPQAALILAGMTAALAGEWALLAPLAVRPTGRTLPLGLAVAAGGAAITIMLSGYSTGGQLGLPLAAALAAISLAALAFRLEFDGRGALGVGLVGLFGLLIIGRFFGSLATPHALILLAAPLLCWLPELVSAVRKRPWLRPALQLALVVLPVILAVRQAQQKFIADSRPPAATTPAVEPSMQDYMDFGK